MPEFKARGKLRNKIFLTMAVVGVVPVLVAGVISIWSISVSHKNDVARLEDALIEQATKAIKNDIDNIVIALPIKTNYDQIRDVSSDDKKDVFDARLKAFPGLVEVVSVDLEGKEVIRLYTSHLDGFMDDSQDIGGTEEFLKAKNGFIYGGPVRFIDGSPEITFSAPIMNKNGVVLSVIIVRVSLERMRTILQNIVVGQTGYLYLVDSKGKVIASGLNGPPSFIDMLDVGIVKSVLGVGGFSGPEGQRRYNNFYEEPVVATGRFLEMNDLAESRWGLVAEWPAKEADAVINQLYQRNGIILFLVFVVVILFSILLSMFIVRPIRALEQGAERVAEGKFDEGVEIDTGDELEELGFHFNKMMVGLKQLEELKNEFVFIAAHELRTPVAAMKGYLTLVLDGMTGPITGKTKDFIEKVVNSNQRLIQLVNDLLEVSRSEGGKLTIKVAPIDVTEPVRGVFTELQSLADKASVQLIYAPTADLPKISADADRLKEVLVNLIGNSIKYMGPPSQNSSGEASGLRTVTVSHEAQGKNLITRIADTGLGMSKEAQGKLFEKFYRVQTEKTQSIQGTGLGLFIVKQIIEKMNGRIWAESEEGKGSTFSFSLPVA
ncbi:MAG: hypothetical protein A2945_03565 [Candidatus Liptonbacteria bacterium RIFCSPLOWO2_01_FULL_52_25]|uniref:histidine kinase n=1 Tax=Candidatus Liptonbacteria bacterium RIFCSPLOWO2_01_FULL_52_25 TaxID=1798650 RepID=A0A1G2CGP2_9BACT|nr:MAG: hypothetical protein A2945_03565 [Candidatus Liptonbacteria bacterium RIFCSPLOWO2_01_FULL_52_25]